MGRFGDLLTRVMPVMVLVVLAVHVVRAKPASESSHFALTLAVGLAAELLTAILSITRAHGAQRMARRGVFVHRLNAIENFGIPLVWPYLPFNSQPSFVP